MKKCFLITLFFLTFYWNSKANPPDQITTIRIVDVSNVSRNNVLATFGHVFKEGDVPQGSYLQAKLSAGEVIDLQVDVKATHKDGSLRHAVITCEIPFLAAKESVVIILSNQGQVDANTGITLQKLLETGYDTSIHITLEGQLYTSSAKELLQKSFAIQEEKKWLEGKLVTEWHVSAPIENGNGGIHPHLTARFYIRAYELDKVRTDVVIENNWTYVADPKGFLYEVEIKSNSNILYSKKGLSHTHHARWRKVFWWGDKNNVHVDYNISYFLETRAIPNYDQSIIISETALAGMEDSFEPMDNGNLTSYMPRTGQHADIGPLPDYGARYMLTMDSRAYFNTLANGNSGGAYQIHFRDKNTDLPVSIDDYPYIGIRRISDTRNPSTGKYEVPANQGVGFYAITNGLSRHTPDSDHQPSIAYLPYLITGDYFYLEELQFWTTYNFMNLAVGYRGMSKGLYNKGQVRGQAWNMRTLGQTAYITPDNHTLKKYFEEKLNNNLREYKRQYVDNVNSNTLHVINPTDEVLLSPWQDNFFTWTMGYINGLGYNNALSVLRWKTVFPVGIMTPPFCWLKSSSYTFDYVDASGREAENFSELYDLNYSSADKCEGLEMNGYPESPTGYGANMQPALAASVDAETDGAFDAWARYLSRLPKQDYTSSPQFAIVPYEVTNPDPDTEPPRISCISEQELICEALLVPDYTELVEVTDNVDPIPVITQEPMAGSPIVDGMQITITATDANDNSSNCIFRVYQQEETVEAGEDQDIREGETIQLHAEGTSAGVYSWSPSIGLSASDIANPMANPNQTITYTVVFTNNQGCVAEDSITVYVTPRPEDKTRYGFSPDGDGINEYWEIYGIENYPNNRVLIYNRWGDLVYEIEGYNNTSKVFRGIANRKRSLGGDKLPEGTYFFNIKINGPHNLKKETGFLVLKR
ncbi:gliding motility-associated C-terminal domain-containing protein [Aquimarina aquimarini]|uniref:T9SS type B sorting domain-containing protein n=1 Tax=Aquimarina aquimarini TaxID=1191734 RepID=UPI000D54CB34|nr:gliding motility-associated C-terminal domain-containing protein [Aquimarina aquimarini]